MISNRVLSCSFLVISNKFFINWKLWKVILVEVRRQPWVKSKKIGMRKTICLTEWHAQHKTLAIYKRSSWCSKYKNEAISDHKHQAYLKYIASLAVTYFRTIDVILRKHEDLYLLFSEGAFWLKSYKGLSKKEQRVLI